MKKLIFYMTGGFDTHGPSNHLLEKLLLELLKNNYYIVLIQSKNNDKNEKIPNSLKPFNNLAVELIRKKEHKKQNLIRRYISNLSYSFKTKKTLKKYKSIDVAFIQSTFTSFFQIRHFKKNKNRKIIYNVQDMFPGSAIASGKIKNKILIYFFRKLQKKAYDMADVITAISEDMKIKLVEEGVQEAKIQVIRNWYDEQNVRQVKNEENIFIQNYNININKFIIQYAGGMGYVFEYENIITIAKELLNYSDIEFHIVGQGSRLEEFKETVKNEKLNNIKFFPLQPQSIVSHVYSASSICLIPLKKGIIGNSVPSKVALVMACKKIPISIVDKSQYYDEFKKNNIGYTFTHDEINEIPNIILELKDNNKLYKEISENAYAFTEKNYSSQIGICKYIEILEALI